MHLHEFMARMHQVVKPQNYLEVGVQHGTSLKLATTAARAVGIDPAPLHIARDNQVIYKMTSDDYFDAASDAGGHALIDLGFIDGLHHYEQALRDFLNMERYVHEKSIIVFDDILPRNQEEATREQNTSDWTGDVWKVTHMLLKYRPELRIREVDTSPTGTLVVWGFLTGKPGYVPRSMDRFVKEYMNLTEVPQATLDRNYAIDPEAVLADIEEFLA